MIFCTAMIGLDFDRQEGGVMLQVSGYIQHVGFIHSYSHYSKNYILVSWLGDVASGGVVRGYRLGKKCVVSYVISLGTYFVNKKMECIAEDDGALQNVVSLKFLYCFVLIGCLKISFCGSQCVRRKRCFFCCVCI
eukprot:TRINITY_DN76_c4_g1_i1.p3 TRINITY_DN76_c4_g1~~TRINITY_DN76_c4_g1_i1.p3  ORF type:complete len:135 (+),score=5.10 TRINITY_DN76_c4_g1_i1:925-1329(+)